LSFKSLFVFNIVLFLVCSTAGQSARSTHKSSSQAIPKDAPAQQPIEALTPLSPEQMPASPPQVAFSNDTLTINANNATLGDILRAVHRQTGATVDMPGNATDRVVGRFGPGPVRDVMTSLLNGSHFNYVLMGSLTNPNGLDRIVLISKSSGMDQTAPQPNVAAAQNNAAMGVPQPADNSDGSADDSADTTMPENNDSADDQANQAQTSEDQQQPPAQNPFGQGAVKTPEQLLQELQQRQQQMQQQMQQQGNPQGLPQAPVQNPQPPQ
jgi:hypothetical protein